MTPQIAQVLEGTIPLIEAALGQAWSVYSLPNSKSLAQKTWCLEGSEKGSETETREVLGGTEDKSVSSTMVQ